MTPDERSPLREDVAKMRREFDQLFAASDPTPAGETEDFVTVRVGGRSFALRAPELAWIEAGRKVVVLPGAHPWLLGLVSARGKFVPVYSLEIALGLPATPAAKPWIAICGQEDQFGLAFDALEGYFRIPRTAVLGTGSTEADGAHTQQAVRTAGGVWPVVSLTSVRVAVRALASHRSTV